MVWKNRWIRSVTVTGIREQQGARRRVPFDSDLGLSIVLSFGHDRTRCSRIPQREVGDKYWNVEFVTETRRATRKDDDAPLSIARLPGSRYTLGRGKWRGRNWDGMLYSSKRTEIGMSLLSMVDVE